MSSKLVKDKMGPESLPPSCDLSNSSYWKMDQLMPALRKELSAAENVYLGDAVTGYSLVANSLV